MTVTAEIVIEPMTETTVIGKVNNLNDYIVKVLDPVSFKNGRQVRDVLVKRQDTS